MNLTRDSNTVYIFYVFVTLLVIGLTVALIFQQINQVTSAQIIFFAALITAYLGLYWSDIYLNERMGWFFMYHSMHTAILLAVSLTPFFQGSISTLVIALAGEAVGIWGNTRRSLGIVAYYTIFTAALSFSALDFNSASGILLNTLVNGGIILIILALYNRQLEERERAQQLFEELGAAHKKLGKYAEQIEKLTLEAERERMARELHDTLAQGVAGIILQLEAIKAHHQLAHVEQVSVSLEQALKRARNTLTESRAAIEDLRLQETESFGRAIENQVDQFSRLNGIPYELSLQLDEQNHISALIQHHARRVLDEALANTSKHARASCVQVSVTQNLDSLSLLIEDDGVGFDTTARLEEGHFGLQGLGERAQLTQGEFTLESILGQGTRIRFVFPLGERTYG